MKGKDLSSLKHSKHVDLDSDSEFEGFVDDISHITQSSNSKGKVSSSQPKSGKKGSVVNLKSGSKVSFEAANTKDHSGKGGKSFSASKTGGKGSMPQATSVNDLLTEVQLNLELDLPKNAKMLMDCEALEVLTDIQDHITSLSEDPSIKMPESFAKGLNYSKISSHYTSAESVKKVLGSLKTSGVTDGEICMIANVCPESVEEAYSLIPSLKAKKHKNEEAIRHALTILAKFKLAK